MNGIGIESYNYLYVCVVKKIEARKEIVYLTTVR
jgi:hypothetical protein